MASFTPILTRLLASSEQVTESGCWIWMRGLDKDGYGSMKVRQKCHKVHRLSYETFVGSIPNGAEIDHLCFVRCCINPHHLEPVDRTTHITRSRWVLSNRTHCKHGHNLTLPNSLCRAAGQNRCRLCVNDAQKRRYHRRRAAIAKAEGK